MSTLQRMRNESLHSRSGPITPGSKMLVPLPTPQPEVLEKLFGLTRAEAELAIRIGRGDTLKDVALENGVSTATVSS